jgi:hypothetical protein
LIGNVGSPALKIGKKINYQRKIKNKKTLLGPSDGSRWSADTRQLNLFTRLAAVCFRID